MARLPKAPSTPKGFSRDVIEVGTRISRRWAEHPIDRIKAGDLVPDFGYVQEWVLHWNDRHTELTVWGTNTSGDVKWFKFEMDLLDPKVPCLLAFSEG